MDNNAPSMLKATMIGGGVAGFVGGIPILGALNCACCSLIVGGGFLAAYLYSKECSGAGFEFRPATGATVGLIAGLFYSVVMTVVQGVFSTILGGVEPEDQQKFLDQMEDAGVPYEWLDIFEQAVEMLQGPVGLLINFFVTLLIAALFSTLGGLIGGAVFKIEGGADSPGAPPPAPTADV